MDSNSRPQVTYEQLGATLLQLGFTRADVENMTVYSETKSEAIIILPRLSSALQVSEQHLIAVEKTLEWKGILSPAQFHARLGETIPGNESSRELTAVG